MLTTIIVPNRWVHVKIYYLLMLRAKQKKNFIDLILLFCQTQTDNEAAASFWLFETMSLCILSKKKMTDHP